MACHINILNTLVTFIQLDTENCVGNEQFWWVWKIRSMVLNRVSNMSAHVLLNLLNELRKRDKMPDSSSILSFFATSFMNSIHVIQ